MLLQSTLLRDTEKCGRKSVNAEDILAHMSTFHRGQAPYYKRGHSANMSIKAETEILDKGFLTLGAATIPTMLRILHDIYLRIWGKGKGKQGCKDISLQSNKNKTK